MNLRRMSSVLATAAMLALAQPANASPIGSQAGITNDSAYAGTFDVAQPAVDNGVQFSGSDIYLIPATFTWAQLDVVYTFDGPGGGIAAPTGAALANPVPEPGTLALFAIAGAGLLARRKRKR